jgi:hypothetical protein
VILPYSNTPLPASFGTRAPLKATGNTGLTPGVFGFSNEAGEKSRCGVWGIQDRRMTPSELHVGISPRTSWELILSLIHFVLRKHPK